MSISFWVGEANQAREPSTGRCLYKGFAPPASSAKGIDREKTTQTPQSKGLLADSLGPVILSLKPEPSMSQARQSVRTLNRGHWIATYFIGVTGLALALMLVVNLMLLSSSQNPWQMLLDSLSFSVAVLLVGLVLITLIAALPCILFFWLAQRYSWRQLWIYLVSGALAAQLAIPVMTKLLPELFNLPYGVSPVLHYLQQASMFGGCGVFLGGLFWWRSGRHLH